MSSHAGSTENGQKQEPELSREADRELDALIAEKVFGGPEHNVQWYWWSGSTPSLPIDPPLYAGPQFSTDIAAAWTIVEKMVELLVMARWEFRAESHGTYDAELWMMEEDGSWTCLAEEDDLQTMPLAICHAALTAITSISSPTE